MLTKVDDFQFSQELLENVQYQVEKIIEEKKEEINESRVDFIKILPVEIIELILKQLPTKDLARCILVSKAWQVHATSDACWKNKEPDLQAAVDESPFAYRRPLLKSRLDYFQGSKFYVLESFADCKVKEKKHLANGKHLIITFPLISNSSKILLKAKPLYYTDHREAHIQEGFDNLKHPNIFDSKINKRCHDDLGKYANKIEIETYPVVTERIVILAKITFKGEYTTSNSNGFINGDFTWGYFKQSTFPSLFINKLTKSQQKELMTNIIADYKEQRIKEYKKNVLKNYPDAKINTFIKSSEPFIRVTYS